MAMLYLVLCLGAITTVYPFLLMLGTGFKGPTDQNDNKLIPSYWSNSSELLEKYIDDKYSGDKTFIGMIKASETKASAETLKAYEEFLMQLPPDRWQVGFRIAANQVTSRVTILWQNWLRTGFKDIHALNETFLEENVDFQTVPIPAELYERRVWSPKPTEKWKAWLTFRSALPAEFRIPVRSVYLYQRSLMMRFQNQISKVPASLKGEAKRFEDITAVTLPSPDNRASQEFWTEWIPPRYSQVSTEELWTKFQKDRGLTPGSMPLMDFEKSHVAAHTSQIRGEFSKRNYAYVLDYILLHGNAVLNTIFFCLLSIATQLIVNPLAAYALSRYPIRASGKILIFLLATMAFPAEVAMIPSFLLLKDLGLLNTFAALVLPGAASGYMIFLLKGFFDSLPQELFEAAQLDGAKESVMMGRIAFPMSKPVLGYLALLAFMGSYGAFIYAFLIAQDQRMWTLMVWIYQLQNGAPRSVMMAALTLAAVPTLLVFLATQRVILRGIVLPGER